MEEALIGAPINIHTYVDRIIPLHDPPEHLTTHKTNIFDLPLGVPGPLETNWLPLCQILSFGTALGLEI